MILNEENISGLWDDITPKLYGYLVNTLRDKDLASDIMQNAWLKAIENLSNFKEIKGASFSSWIFKIAVNETRQHWRKNGREVPFDIKIHDKAVTYVEGDQVFIEKIISMLPEGDKELVRLRFIADLPFTEISKILGISGVAARVRLHRVLLLAKNILKNENYV